MKVLALLSVLGAVVIARADVTIDDFTSGPDSVSIYSGNQFFEQSGTMLGGSRIEELDILSNIFSAPLGFDSSGGFGSFNAGLDVTSAPGLGWGYHAAADHSGFTTFDLNADFTGLSLFQLTFAANEHAMTGSVEVNLDPSTLTNFSVAAATSPQTVDVSFLSMGSVDWSHVHQIAIIFNDPSSNDFTMSGVSAVPEPASAAFVTLGALGLLTRRRLIHIKK